MSKHLHQNHVISMNLIRNLNMLIASHCHASNLNILCKLGSKSTLAPVARNSPQICGTRFWRVTVTWWASSPWVKCFRSLEIQRPPSMKGILLKRCLEDSTTHLNHQCNLINASVEKANWSVSVRNCMKQWGFMQPETNKCHNLHAVSDCILKLFWFWICIFVVWMPTPMHKSPRVHQVPVPGNTPQPCWDWLCIVSLDALGQSHEANLPVAIEKLLCVNDFLQRLCAWDWEACKSQPCGLVWLGCGRNPSKRSTHCAYRKTRLRETERCDAISIYDLY